MGEHVLAFVLPTTHSIPASPSLVPGDAIVDLSLSFSPWELGRAPAADLGSKGFLSGTLCKQSFGVHMSCFWGRWVVMLWLLLSIVDQESFKPFQEDELRVF